MNSEKGRNKQARDPGRLKKRDSKLRGSWLLSAEQVDSSLMMISMFVASMPAVIMMPVAVVYRNKNRETTAEYNQQHSDYYELNMFHGKRLLFYHGTINLQQGRVKSSFKRAGHSQVSHSRNQAAPNCRIIERNRRGNDDVSLQECRTALRQQLFKLLNGQGPAGQKSLDPVA